MSFDFAELRVSDVTISANVSKQGDLSREVLAGLALQPLQRSTHPEIKGLGDVGGQPARSHLRHPVGRVSMDSRKFGL